ncbi:MAG: T9SS type A sorting domain-containing protein [Salinivirgaceae bacterium]|nr:T9SS type A sorting domain-containing protein [Salinivirgaceae bacterium]
MKKLLFWIAIIFMGNNIWAQGDTLVINAHNETHLNWYGRWDNWVDLPDGSNDYHKILLDITLGCPTGGCSEWDYTVKFELLHNTHELDSILELAPSFTVNNNVIDTFNFNLTPTFLTVFNEQTASTELVKNDSLWIQQFNSIENPFQQTDSLKVWPANYYNYEFSSNGTILDSTLIVADSTWVVEYAEVYNVYEIILPFELARIMTPYAGNYSLNWKHTYTFDVTDFTSILKDSVKVRVFYGGWQDGFTASLDFKFIEGTPPREALSIENIYSSGMGGFIYGNPETSIETFLNAKKMNIVEDAMFAKIRYTASGHSFGGAENCAEFCPKNYYLKINENVVDTQLIWKSCGINALYPQAGTWLYDRAGWCPGDKTDTYIHDISNMIDNNDSIVIDVDMAPYTYDFNAGFHPIYIVESQMVQYGPMNFITEASIEEIIAPNNDPRYSRNNPFGTRPLIKVKNNGSDDLLSLDFEYNINGNETQNYHWTGEIKSLENAIIELPSIDYELTYDNQGEVRKFNIYIRNPNDKEDEWGYNNESSSLFDAPSVYNEFFFLELKTNKRPEENYLEIRNAEGEVVFLRDNMLESTRYRDTLNLDDGFYELVLTDEGGDGLSFWANNSITGVGSIGFYRAQYDVIEQLQIDFGSILYHCFYVENTVGIINNKAFGEFTIYPNPAKESININTNFNFSNSATVCIADVSGKIYLTTSLLDQNQEILINDLAKGVYIISIIDNGFKSTQKLMIF